VIPCPKCGGDTTVRETRGAHRRRVCKDYSCAGALHTVEVDRGDLTAMRRMFDAMEGRASEE
jgi:hypothetical protein